MARFLRDDLSSVVFDFPASVKAGDTISVIKADGTLASVLVQAVHEVAGGEDENGKFDGMRLATVK